MPENTPGDSATLPTLAQDYLKQEQAQRREEIESLMARVEADQKAGLLFTGAIWAWFATNADKLDGCLSVVVGLPALLVGFFLYCSWIIHTSIHEAADYTRELENLFAVPNGYGWERWLAGRQPRGRSMHRLARTVTLFWVGLILVNLGLTGLFWVSNGLRIANCAAA